MRSLESVILTLATVRCRARPHAGEDEWTHPNGHLPAPTLRVLWLACGPAFFRSRQASSLHVDARLLLRVLSPRVMSAGGGHPTAGDGGGELELDGRSGLGTRVAPPPSRLAIRPVCSCSSARMYEHVACESTVRSMRVDGMDELACRGGGSEAHPFLLGSLVAASSPHHRLPGPQSG